MLTSRGILFTPGQHAWPKGSYDFALIILIGVFGFIAQALLTFGLQREKAGRAGLASYMQILFAVVLELFVFHTIPSFLSFVGMSIILSAAAWVAVSTGTKRHGVPLRSLSGFSVSFTGTCAIVRSYEL